MSLVDFIESNYQAACEMQRSIERDSKMKEMVAKSLRDEALVFAWMRDYGLVQGVNAAHRKAVVNKYLSTLPKLSKLEKGQERNSIEENFRHLLSELYSSVNRKWLSATSKLLWCSYPDHVVIYDAFVERALVTLQGITPYLASLPRLNTSPDFRLAGDIEAVMSLYRNYQNIVLAIASEHKEQLDELRNTYKETYAHDMRIIDKLLWMLGNPKQEFRLNGAKCRTY